jgi:hypothetical protein
MAGMIIVFILLAHQTLPSVRDADWEVVEGLIRVMDRTAAEMPNGVATEASQLLRDLTKLRDSGPANGKFHAVIPYFGKITFRINKQGISQSDL